MGALSGVHWLIIAIVAAFLFFGWKQLPDMARSMGRSLRVFKTEIKGMTDDDKARDRDRDESAAAADQQPKQLPPRPAPAAARVTEQRQAPRADVVRNTAAAPAPSVQGTRPRPAPRSHG